MRRHLWALVGPSFLHLGGISPEDKEGELVMGAQGLPMHTFVCSRGFFHSREKTAQVGLAQASPCHLPLVPFTPCLCVPPLGPRPKCPACLFNPTGCKLALFYVLQNFSVLALTCSGTEQPNFSLVSLEVTNENLLFLGTEDLEEDAFMGCPGQQQPLLRRLHAVPAGL